MKFNFSHVTIKRKGGYYKITVIATSQVFYFNPLTWKFVGNMPDSDLKREVCKEIDTFDFELNNTRRESNRFASPGPKIEPLGEFSLQDVLAEAC